MDCSTNVFYTLSATTGPLYTGINSSQATIWPVTCTYSVYRYTHLQYVRGRIRIAFEFQHAKDVIIKVCERVVWLLLDRTYDAQDGSRNAASDPPKKGRLYTTHAVYDLSWSDEKKGANGVEGGGRHARC